MQISSAVSGRYDFLRHRAFSWRDSLSISSRAGLALCMAAMTGAAAQMRLPLPGTPVPVTGQVFLVLLCGVLLGGGYGALGLTFYLGLGCAGLPWFSGFAGGSGHLIGVTGGYLIGFVPAALFIGFAADRIPPSPALRPLYLTLIMLAGVGIIYLFGALQFAAFTGAGFQTTVSMAIVPFIPWDIMKALLAGIAACAILPRNR